MNRCKFGLFVSLSLSVLGFASSGSAVSTLPILIGDKHVCDGVRCSVEEAAPAMDESLPIRGVVVSKPDAGFVRLSIGVMQNVSPEAEFAFFKNGQRIGSGRAVQVDWNDTLVAVPEDVYQKVYIGTPVRVVSNPAKSKRITEPQKRIKQESRAGLDPSSR
jgi:hypothetical protein